MYKGFIKDLSNEDYHADLTHNSSSTLKLALDDPLEFYNQRVLGKPAPIFNKEALDLGSYMHTALLEPEKLNDEYIIWHGAARGKKWEQFKTFYEQEKKTILTSSQIEKAEKCFKSFAEARIELADGELIKAPKIFTGGIAEESLFIDLEGMPIKVRTDYRNEKTKAIIDLKTTAKTVNTISEATNVINAYKYDLSAALYIDAINKETGDNYDFYWLFISKKDYKINLYKMSKERYNKGKAEYMHAISAIKEWTRTGEYQSFTKEREI